MVGPEPSKLMMRLRSSSSAPISFSTVPIGRGARLLISSFEVRILGGEPMTPARRGSLRESPKLVVEGSTPSAGANTCREPASAGICLQNRRSRCDPLAALQFDGGRGEAANATGCEPVITGSTPVAHPMPT